MKKRTNRKAAAVSPGAAKKTNTAKRTTGKTAEQLILSGMPPPPERGEGPVELYLRTRPGWHDRLIVAEALSLPCREVRLQAEHSGGLIIFGSGRGQGLKHAEHADTWEMNACRAELINRATSHLRRADEIESISKRRRAGQ